MKLSVLLYFLLFYMLYCVCSTFRFFLTDCLLTSPVIHAKNGQRTEILEQDNMTHEELMREAIRLSEENVKNGGGPFGAVIAKEGKIIAVGTNRVTPDCDPTAHAEVSAIRAACKALGTFNLAGCSIYSSCEPCPMCLAAIYWAHLDCLYYGNNKQDAAKIGFDDAFIYDEFAKAPVQRRLKTEILLPAEAFTAFQAWLDKEDKVEY